MKLGFDEPQSSYTSGSQSARSWTEAWVSAQAYCPHCGNAKMSQFPNNSPLADFLCTSCNEEFELKSQKGKFGAKVADGAYKKKCERLAASNNPNLLLMNYDLKTLAVVNLLIVPKHFFVRDIIKERKPLAATARRAGWIGRIFCSAECRNQERFISFRMALSVRKRPFCESGGKPSS
jgi:type II restriction enzyme